MSDLITSSNVLTLRRAFEEAENEELTIEEFVTVMTNVVLRARVKARGDKEPTHEEEISFAVDMVELFKQIDVNGNGLMEWSEFTAYIVETGRMLENKETLALRKTTEAGFFVGERESRYAYHANQVTNVECGHRDDNEVVQEGGIIPIGEPFNCLAVLTQCSDVIRLYALPMRPGQQGFNQYKPQTLRHHTQFRAHRALGITHIPSISVGVEGETFAYIVSSSVDDKHGTGCFISFWSRTKRSMKVVARVSTHNIMDRLTWCSANDTLYAASSTSTSTIEAWKLVMEPSTSVTGESIFILDAQRIASMRWHSSCVTRLRYLPDNVEPLIASFSKDGTVCFWSTHTNRPLANQNIHNRGVRGVAHSVKMRLCVTVGYGNICFPDTLVADVWRIHHGLELGSTANKTRMFDQIATLVGHEQPIVDVILHEYPDDLAHIVTIDERGQIRRWCAHQFVCLQVFEVPEKIHGGEARSIPGRHVGELNAIAPLILEWKNKDRYEPPHPGIVVASGSSFGVLESLPVHHSNKPLLTAKFNSESMTFLTVAARSMRVWDALTGQVLRIYGEDMLFGPGGAGRIVVETSAANHGSRTKNAELTCCALDDRLRKIITGDNKGRICVWNYLNGALMKVLDPHKKDVSSLVYAPNEKLVLSTAWDGTIFVNDELDNNGWNPSARRSVLMRDVHVQREKIKNKYFSRGMGLMTGPSESSDIRGTTPHGKHLQIDIGGITLSNKFGLFATASHIGADLIINCWDMEYMRLLGSAHCPKRVISIDEVMPDTSQSALTSSSEDVGSRQTSKSLDTLKSSDIAFGKLKAMQLPLQIQTSSLEEVEFDRSGMPPPRMPATSPLHSPTPMLMAQHGSTSPQNEIMAICFLEPWLGLCFSDDSGHIFLCNLPTTQKKLTCIGALLPGMPTQNIDGQQSANLEVAPYSSVLSICCRLSPCGDSLHLYAGHEDGSVCLWDLSSDFFKDILGIHRPNKYAYKQPNFNGRRTMRFGTYQARELLPSRSQRGGFEVPRISPNVVAPKKIWKAHNLGDADHPGRDAIVGLQLIDCPNSILATSLNGTATIWGLDPRPTNAEIQAKYEASLGEDELKQLREEKRSKKARQRKKMWLAGMTEDEIREAALQKRLEEEKLEKLEREKPLLLGVLDPDINRSTPDWLFSIDVDERERERIIEARRVLHNAAKIEKEQKKKAERRRMAELSISSLDDARVGENTKVKKKNKHDFLGHDFVEQALVRAFSRPSSNQPLKRRSVNLGSSGPNNNSSENDLFSPKNDFSSSGSGLTAEMLVGRAASGSSGEMMKWRREAAAEKKKNRGRPRRLTSATPSLPQLGRSTANHADRVSSASMKSFRKTGDLRMSILSQLERTHKERGSTQKHKGYVPCGQPGGRSSKIWFEFAGSRSAVPKARYVDSADGHGTVRNDGWDGAGEAMSDTLSIIGDRAEDLDEFYVKKMDPADEWIDRTMSDFASSVNLSMKEERLNPIDSVTNLPKGMGVAETIYRRKQASRLSSLSKHGRKIRVSSGC